MHYSIKQYIVVTKISFHFQGIIYIFLCVFVYVCLRAFMLSCKLSACSHKLFHKIYILAYCMLRGFRLLLSNNHGVSPSAPTLTPRDHQDPSCPRIFRVISHTEIKLLFMSRHLIVRLSSWEPKFMDALKDFTNFLKSSSCQGFIVCMLKQCWSDLIQCSLHK